MNHTFSLRLSRYVADWLITKYGNASKRYLPIDVPTAHPVGKIIYRCLQSNDSFKCLTTKCYCQMMLQRRGYSLPAELQSQLPKDISGDGEIKLRDVLVPIVVPEAHRYNGRLISCDDTMQLDSKAAIETIEMFKEEFWNDLEDYAETYFRFRSLFNQNLSADRKKMDAWDMILDFCDFWQIDNDATDAIYRQLHRLLKTNKIQISNLPRRKSNTTNELPL